MQLNEVQKLVRSSYKGRGDFKRTSDIDLAVSDGKFDRFALH